MYFLRRYGWAIAMALALTAAGAFMPERAKPWFVSFTGVLAIAGCWILDLFCARSGLARTSTPAIP